MILTQHTRAISVLVILLGAMVAPSSAQLIVDIAPVGGNIVFTVSWSSVPGVFNGTWPSMDPATGAETNPSPWGTVESAQWDDVGDAFDVYNLSSALRAFGDTVDSVVSSPNGWGVIPDDDGVGTADDFLIFNTGGSIPSSGAFTLTVPGANIDKYNIGVHVNNPNATLTVVPEPSSLAFLGLLGVVATGWQWMRRRQVKANG